MGRVKEDYINNLSQEEYEKIALENYLLYLEYDENVISSYHENRGNQEPIDLYSQIYKN